jgi:hypothetical protein
MRMFLRAVAWCLDWYIEHFHPRLMLESKLYRVNEVIFDVLAEKELWRTS